MMQTLHHIDCCMRLSVKTLASSNPCICLLLYRCFKKLLLRYATASSKQVTANDCHRQKNGMPPKRNNQIIGCNTCCCNSITLLYWCYGNSFNKHFYGLRMLVKFICTATSVMFTCSTLTLQIKWEAEGRGPISSRHTSFPTELEQNICERDTAPQKIELVGTGF